MKIVAKIEYLTQKFFQVEKAKIKSRGIFNFALSYFLLFLLYLIGPQVGKAIWPEHIEDHAAFLFKCQSVFSLTVTFLCLFIYLPGYLGVKSYKKYEITPQLKRPWERSNWNSKLKKTVFYYLFNKGIVFPAYLYMLLKLAPVKMDFSREGLPNSWQLFTTMIKIQIVDDFFYMWAHRAFHEFPSLYKYHKIHHQWETTISVIGQYCHPIEQVFVNVIPGTISLSFFRVHGFTLFFWIFYKFYSSSQAHSGYQFPWSPFKILPFVYGPSYHQYHHTKNVGNYSGNNYFMQMVFGTNSQFIDSQLKKINGEQKQEAKKL